MTNEHPTTSTTGISGYPLQVDKQGNQERSDREGLALVEVVAGDPNGLEAVGDGTAASSDA